MPDLGGSYFTFSNENNDLIWGFLAECHRRGWLYKGHDTMPWCARCGTGLSQMEMNEGYQDREDPGLTVRFPLLDRPGESLLVWTTTPWTLTSNVAAAVGPTLALRPGPPGRRDASGSARARSRRPSSGPFEVLEERRRRGAGRLALRGPVRRPARPSGRPSPPGRGTQPGPPLRASRRRLGRGRRGRGDRHRPHRPRLRRGGLPARQGARPAGHRAARRGRAIFVDGFGSLSGRDVRDVAEPIVEHLKREGRFYRLEPSPHRYPHCWRCGTPLVFRLVDEWYISMGPVYDQPRETLTTGAGRREPALPDHGGRRPDPLDPGLRLRARARLAPQHARLDDQQEALLGAGAADLRLRGVRDGRGHRRSRGAPASGRSRAGRRSRATRRTGPTSTRCKIACPGCGAPVERIKDVGNPWLDAGIVPFSTLHFREDPDVLGASGSRPTSSPRASRASSATGSTRCSRCRPSCGASRRSRRSSATPLVFGEDGRPMHKSWGNAIEFDEAAERMGVDVMRWMFAKARPEENILFGWHAADEARRELLVLWNVYAFFVTYARLAGWTPDRGRRRRSPSARPSTAGSCRGPRARPRASRTACATSTRLRRDAGAVGASSTTCRPGTCACRASGSRARDDRRRPRRGLRDAPRGARGDRPDARPDPAVPGRGDVREPGRGGRPGRARQRPPDALADARARARTATSALEAAMADAQARRRAGPDAARPGAAPDAPAARAGLAGAAGPRRSTIGDDAARAHRRRGQRQGGRARSATTRRSSSGASSRSCRRSASGSGRRSRRSWPPPATGEVEFEADGSVTLGRRDPRPRRGRDPGDAATRDGGRPRRRPRRRHRHRADAGAARRGRRPRARSARSRTCAARPASSSTTGSSCGSAPLPAAVAAHLPIGGRRRRSPSSSAGAPPAERRTGDGRARRRPGGHRLAPPRRAARRSRDGRRVGRRRRGWRRATDRGRPRRDAGAATPLAARPLGRLPRRSPASVVVLDQLTKAWLVSNVSPGEVVTSSATSSGSSSARTPGRCSACSATRRSCSGSSRSASIGLIVAYHGRVRAEPVPVDRARPAARRRDRQPDRSAPPRLRRRLRRHRASATSASTRSTSPTRRSAPRSSCSSGWPSSRASRASASGAPDG